MANQKNRKVPRVLESLNLSFAGACEPGKLILYDGILDNRILLADWLRHSRICPQCAKVIGTAVPQLNLVELASMLKGFIL